MDNVTKLPTAATSYYTVNKAGRWYYVTLVTPIEGARPLKTRLYAFDDRASALEYGARTAERMKRPFKVKGGAA